MLKINSKDILQLDSIQDILHKRHTEVTASENVGVLTALWSLLTS